MLRQVAEQVPNFLRPGTNVLKPGTNAACDLAVYASPLRLPPRRKTRFRAAATLTRTGLPPARSVRKVSETPRVSTNSRHLIPLPQALPGAHLARFGSGTVPERRARGLEWIPSPTAPLPVVTRFLARPFRRARKRTPE